MKKIFALFTIIFIVLNSACSDFEKELDGFGTPSQKDTVIVVVTDTVVIGDTVVKTPVWVDITINGDTVMRDADGDIIWHKPDFFVAKITCQDTVMVSADKPWELVESQENPQTPAQYYLSGVSQWALNHGTLSAIDSVYGGFRGRILPRYPKTPCTHEVEEFEPTVTDTTTSRNVHYVLIINTNVMGSAPQVQGTKTGIVPAYFQTMVWRSWHVGPATAIYADGQATITCPDSLVAYEVWDDGSNRNWLRKTTTSKDIFSVTVSGTEVDDINAVVGNNLSVNGDKASVAEFSVTVTRTSKDIVEKNVPYTYNGRSINFVDSLHACGYKLKGGQVISKSQVRVDMAHEDTGEIVSFIIPVTFTEKLRVVSMDSLFTHINYISPASYSNSIITVDANHNAEFIQHYSDGSEKVSNINYLQHINFRVSYDKQLVVENLNQVLGRHQVVNGKVTVYGNDFEFDFVSCICDNIIFEGKNYKQYAPKCNANIVAITIEKDKLIVEIQGDHDGDNSTIYVELPLEVTEIITIPGKILGGNRADAYEGQTTGRVTWDFIKTLNLSSGKYTVHSKKEEEINFNNHEEYTSFGNLTNSDPFSYWYDQIGEKHLGTFEAIKMDKSKEAYLILFKNFYKETMYTLGTAEDAINNPYRNPNRGVLQKVVKGGKTLWTFDYKVYYIGSED